MADDKYPNDTSPLISAVLNVCLTVRSVTKSVLLLYKMSQKKNYAVHLVLFSTRSSAIAKRTMHCSVSVEMLSYCYMNYAYR